MCKGLAALPATCLKSAKDIKHRIGFLLQRPEPPPEQKALKEKEKVTEAKRTNPVETEKWKASFSSLINNEVGRGAFMAFLKSEFSQENMEFWLACEDYKKTPTNKMDAKARKIFKQYVEVDSPNEVNLDSATREETRKNLEKSDVSCFDEAQNKIFILMEKDSYRRFLKSKLFLDLAQLTPDGVTCGLEKRAKRHHAGFNQCLPHCT
ncbi:regulator of G-protein signaling 4 [Chanos chanos]|uniref:Regulator of G-protein signaling 4 n=1 Tax=Chanos chanos TaxID=29144 RepID=A0A6J2WSZ7_CHACN|nr:regulator of G-protein signaling 4 [Chanos chanos]